MNGPTFLEVVSYLSDPPFLVILVSCICIKLLLSDLIRRR